MIAPSVLVLGANGFIGSHVTARLLKDGWRVRAFYRRLDPLLIAGLRPYDNFEAVEGSVTDEQALGQALRGTNSVLCFTTFSFPATAPQSLHYELQTTLAAMELLLRLMQKEGVKNLIFPSSGGTVYGDIGSRRATEADVLQPMSSYGLGKAICEEMIRFYQRVHHLQPCILRISNVYGAPRIKRTLQGVIDVFLERLKANQPLKVWGATDIVRDYIFIDDVVEVIVKGLSSEVAHPQVINVGTGIETTIRDVILTIEEVTGLQCKYEIEATNFSGVRYNVLDTSLLKKTYHWMPAYDLKTGIRTAWMRKLNEDETQRTI
jgi:UDP-glucose 4-epimerase